MTNTKNEDISSKISELECECDKAKEKIKRQAERIRKLEGATNHATGTPLSKALQEVDKLKLEIIGWQDKWKCAVDMAARAENERDEARSITDRFRSLYYTKLGINKSASWFPWEEAK